MSQQVWGNSYERWASAALLLAAGFLMVSLVRSLLLSKLRKSAPLSATRWDDFFLIALEKTTPVFIFFVFLLVSIRSLILPGNIGDFLQHAFTFIMFLQVGRWLSAGLSFYAKPYTTIQSDQDAARATMMRSVFLMGNIVIWLAITIQILDNWGVKVSALVAGLGVGGIAVGLALQNILVDVFASLAIVFDKPFVIGDSIGVGDDSGTVEYIGLKTTRLKSLTGEQLIFSNSDLLKNRIRNYKRQRDRRVTFKIVVPLDTAPEKLEKIPGLVKELIQSFEKIRFDRVNLSAITMNGFEHELVYFVTTADYGVHVAVQQGFFHKLVRRFDAEKIAFASSATVITNNLGAIEGGSHSADGKP